MVLREIRLTDAKDEVHGVQVSRSGDALAIGMEQDISRYCNPQDAECKRFINSWELVA